MRFVEDMRRGYVGLLRSRSGRRAVRDNPREESIMEEEEEEEEEGADAGEKHGCWVNIPPELLRDVLIRIEDSESSWPSRRHVVACAGVCRSWRNAVEEIVGKPESCGKLTFPLSLKQPGPRDHLIQCFIKRSRTEQTFRLYLGLTQALTDTGKFLLVGRKCRRPTSTEYIISFDPNDVSKGSGTYVGKLRSNFLGTKFTIFDGVSPCDGEVVPKNRLARLLSSKQVSPRAPIRNYPIAHIAYGLNVLGSRGPRRMQCIMNTIPACAIKPGGEVPAFDRIDSFSSVPLSHSTSSQSECCMHGPLLSQKDMLILKNKSPRWHEQLQCWCLNFRGRVTVASVKNFQLVASLDNGQSAQEQDKVLLQFGKVGKDLFTMDYRYPLSAFQAFAICLSSFDTKIGCE